MKSEDRTTAYGIGAILVVLAVTAGLIAQSHDGGSLGRRRIHLRLMEG